MDFMMNDIKIIIDFLDDYIETNNLDHLTAIEAGEILSENGLLNNSQDRSGLPLRNLLRSGSIPHAYQLKGKTQRGSFLIHAH